MFARSSASGPAYRADRTPGAPFRAGTTSPESSARAGSPEAAAAYEMAGATGRAEELNDWFFANQPTLSPSVVRQAARDVGHIEDFDAKYAEALKAVRADADMGNKLQVGSTPTLFIDGQLYRGARSVEELDAAFAKLAK